jgi:tetratricopeptide (TPR) repeat protein
MSAVLYTTHFLRAGTLFFISVTIHFNQLFCYSRFALFRRLGNEAFATNQFDPAIKYYMQAICKQPKNHVLFSNRRYVSEMFSFLSYRTRAVFCCYVSSSSYSSPYTDYCIVFALFPYRILNSASYAGLEQWKQAADDAKECIRPDPNFVKGYYRSAVAQIALGEHDSAIATIRQGLVVDNNNLPLTKLFRKAEQQRKSVWRNSNQI